MFFLDTKPEECLRRLESREAHEMFETLDSLIETRRKALALVKDWHIIDSNKSIEETHASIESILDKLDRKDE